MPKVIHPALLALSEEFVRKVTDRWRAEGQQDTPEHVIKATALKIAKSMAFTRQPGLGDVP
jgi:hypothetical protein